MDRQVLVHIDPLRKRTEACGKLGPFLITSCEGRARNQELRGTLEQIKSHSWKCARTEEANSQPGVLERHRRECFLFLSIAGWHVISLRFSWILRGMAPTIGTQSSTTNAVCVEVSVSFFETGLPVVLLLQTSKRWDSRRVPPCLAGIARFNTAELCRGRETSFIVWPWSWGSTHTSKEEITITFNFFNLIAYRPMTQCSILQTFPIICFLLWDLCKSWHMEEGQVG